MKMGLFASRAKKALALAVATTAVAASALLALPSAALADNDAGEVIYYPTKDAIPRPVLDTGSSMKSLLDTARSYAKSSYKVVISLSCDWNTRSYGSIDIPSNANVEFRLNGHMLDRDIADSTYYGSGDGEVFFVYSNATLLIDGGGMSYYHKGKLCNGGKFWESDPNGSDLIFGGLVAGGANDSNKAAGGITVEGDNTKICLKNVTLAGNVSDTFMGSRGDGGGVYIRGDGNSLELDNAKIIYNRAEHSGGGIYVQGKNTTITATNSSISSNSAAFSGGGIDQHGKGGTVTLVNTKVNNNDTRCSGAGIFDEEDGTTFNLENSTVSNNTNTGDWVIVGPEKRGNAGGICLYDVATLNLTKGSKISGNRSYINAGVYMDEEDSVLTMDDGSAIENNVAEGRGGGVTIYGDRFNIVLKGGSKISGNTAGGDGGGISVRAGGWLPSKEILRITLDEGSSICNNSAGESGGGIHSGYEGTIFVVSNDGTGSITGNSAKDGGGYYDGKGATLNLIGVAVQRNSASQSYGGVFCKPDATCYLKGKVHISDNYANQQSSDLCGENLTIGIDGENLITKQSRIGLDVSSSNHSGAGDSWLLFNHENQLDQLGDDYTKVFFCNDQEHKVTRDGSTLKVVQGKQELTNAKTPAQVTGVTAKATGKGKVKMSWAKHETQTDGFQVLYSTSKAKLAKDKGKVAKVKGATKTSKALKGLASGKKHFFKVRAYKVVKVCDGEVVVEKTYYSDWSKVKAVKVK